MKLNGAWLRHEGMREYHFFLRSVVPRWYSWRALCDWASPARRGRRRVDMPDDHSRNCRACRDVKREIEEGAQ